MPADSIVILGRLVDASGQPIKSAVLNVKSISSDGQKINDVTDEKGNLLTTTSGTDGAFTAELKGTVLDQLTKFDSAIVFKKSDQQADTGLTKATPLFARAGEQVGVVLRWDAGTSVLSVTEVSRNGRRMPAALSVRGRILDTSDQPMKGVAVKAELIIPPAPGTALNFPVMFGPIAVGADGRFEVSLPRTGDLLSYRPYARFPWRFMVGLSGATILATLPEADWLYVRPDEQVEIVLRWENGPNGSAALRLVAVIRDGELAAAAQGVQTSLGLLLHKESKQPLVGYRVQVAATASKTAMGEVVTEGRGYFALPHPWPLSVDPATQSKTWYVTVRNDEDQVLATEQQLSLTGISDAALTVEVSLPGAEDRSPTIAKTMTSLGLSFKQAGAANAFLTAQKLQTLRDVLDRGGVLHLKDRPKDEDSVFEALELQASLWSALPPELERDAAVPVLKGLSEQGLQGLAELGTRPRSEVTRDNTAALGDHKSAQLQYVAAARSHLLDTLLIGQMAESRYDAPPPAAGLIGPNPGPLPPVIPPSACSCDECQTAVSANAYLADLIRYTSARARLAVGLSENQVTAKDLQTQFMQPFEVLPLSCASMSEPIRVARIAVEVLRAFGEPRLTDTKVKDAVAATDKAHSQRVYDGFLAGLTVTSAELRLAKGVPPALQELATRLGLSETSEVEALLLADSDINEAKLESLFGFPKTSLQSLVPVADFELHKWRLKQLRKSYVAQDAHETWTAGVPLVDPDVITADDVRPLSSASTDLLKLLEQRRSDIDAELTKLTKSRTLELGTEVGKLLKLGALDDDDKWACGLTALLSESEVLTKAATLPLAERELAREKAAREKVEAAKVARKGTLPLKSTEETAYKATLAYTKDDLGSTLTSAAGTWVKNQLGGLTDAMGGKLSYNEWDTRYQVLKGTANPSASPSPPTPAQVRSTITAYALSEEQFLRLMDLAQRLIAQDPRGIPQSEWLEFNQILVARWKTLQLTDWLASEGLIAAKPTCDVEWFWTPLAPPRLTPWLGSAARRAQWDRVLRASMAMPIVDPDIVLPVAFKSTTTTDKAYALYDTRKRWIEEPGTGLLSTLRAETRATVRDFDTNLLAKYLGLPAPPATPPATPKTSPWYEIEALSLAYENGNMPTERLEQLSLDRAGFQTLFQVRNLLKSATVTAAEWESVFAVLVQVKKRRQYGAWRRAEKQIGLALSPEFFQLPPPPKLSMPPEPPAEAPLLPFRATRADRSDFWGRLTARTADEEALKTSLKSLIDSVESETITKLRDDLIRIFAPDAKADLRAQARWFSDRLLIDFELGACGKTTRVAQAMGTIQTLLFSLSTQNLFLLQQPATSALYPKLSLNSDSFASEWRWMGSYANWRSALFVFLYPENLLYPSLRDPAKQSQVFRDLRADLQSAGRLSPERACAAAARYQSYFHDIRRLSVQATCAAGVPVQDTTACPNPLQGKQRTLLFSFGVAPSGTAYWSTREVNENDLSNGSPWDPIPNWNGVIEILGAVPFNGKQGGRYIIVIGISQDINEPKRILKCARLNLDYVSAGASAWDSATYDLTDPDQDSSSPYSKITYAVEQINLEYHSSNRRPHVYLALTKKSTVTGEVMVEVYRRPLNSDANGWEGGQWADFYFHTQLGAGSVVAAAAWFPASVQIGCLLFGSYKYWWVAKKEGASTAQITEFNIWTWWYYSGLTWLNTDTSKGHILLMFSVNRQKLLPGAIIGGDQYIEDFWDKLDNATITPGSVEKLSLLPSRRPCVDVGATRAQLCWLPTSVATWGGKPLITRTTEFLTPDVPPNVSLTETRGRLPQSDRKKLIKLAYEKNPSPAMIAILDEAFFSLPVHLGLELQRSSYHESALAWFSTVYDYVAPLAERKIYHVLTLEETRDNSYKRLLTWLKDPMNPHNIAIMRRLAYTRFMIITIARCLLDFADASFTEDTSESIPRAHVLYETALKLLDTPDAVLRQDGCDALIAQINFDLFAAEWIESGQRLKEQLRSVLAMTSQDAGAELIATNKAKLAESVAMGTKAQNIQTLLDARLASASQKPTLATVVSNDRGLRARAQLAMHADPAFAGSASQLGKRSGRSFRAALSGLTGIPEQTLDAQKTLTMTWLRAPVALAAFRQDPANRVPVLVPPAQAGVLTPEYRRRTFWDPLDESRAAVEAQLDAGAPAAALIQNLEPVGLYLAAPPVSFCVPPNPLITSLRLRAELNLYKIHTCRNISGIERDLDFYAAPTDATTGLPGLGANGGLSAGGSRRFMPTVHRYATLVERAKRLAQLASQFEGQMFQSIEKKEQEQRSLLDAKNQLKLQQATLGLKQLEIQDAEIGVQLVEKQQERIAAVQEYLQDLINEDVSELEKQSLDFLTTQATLTGIAAGMNTAASIAYGFAAAVDWTHAAGHFASILTSAASAMSGFGSMFGVLSQRVSMQASYLRRSQEWKQQKRLADFDYQIGAIQLRQADIRVRIKQKEEELVQMQVRNSQDVVDFLLAKFTSVELYEWMARIMQGLYSGILQQAAAIAELAEQQLAFDRLEDIQIIKPDYWTVPAEGLTRPGESGGPDRRGLTGSARLQSDIEDLEAYALTTEKRKLQLTRTISLSSLAPGEFQRFRETGELWFATTERDFDREFPGHYFRRIRRVRMTVIALVPPIHGIRATLTNLGPSRAVVPGLLGFETRLLPSSFESVSYTSPQNSSGLFELDPQSDLRLPFEGTGVDTQWRLELPRASNPFDFRSIADVLITFEYTALDSPDYRMQLVQTLPQTVQGVRAFSFRNELADAWRSFARPRPAVKTGDPLQGSFDVQRADFPPHFAKLRIDRLSFYISVAEDSRGNRVDLSADTKAKQIGLIFKGGDSAALNLNKDHVVISKPGDPWSTLLAATDAPFGRWTLELQRTPQLIELFRNELVNDILLAFSYTGTLPEWPKGERPRSSLF